MGSSQSKAVNDVVSEISSTAFTSITNNSSNCRVTTTATQDQGITIVGNHNNVSGYDQSSYLALSTNCQITNATNEQMISSITQLLQSQASSNTSALGDTIKSLVTAFGGDSSSVTSVNSTIATQVSECFTLNNTNDMIASYLTNQNQGLSILGSYNNVSNITQALQLNAITSMTANNSTIISAYSNVSAQSNSSATNTETGPLQELFQGLQGVISSLTGAWAGYAAGAVCLGCCCCCVLLILLLVMSQAG